MNDVMIIGTVALDTIETPFGKVERALGGSATYASYAASFFSKPAIVSVVGRDFPGEYLELIKSRNIDTKGIQVEGKTFHWDGYYEFDMNQAKTKKTELNSLADFKVRVPDSYKKIKNVFLANIDPAHQLEILSQMEKPELIVLDTMNFWISSKRDALMKIIGMADIFVLNDGEARQLFETSNLVKAAKDALALGPKAVIIKKGEHGALLFENDKHFSAPGYPLEVIKDPTGCGDCFGGAIIGYLSKAGKSDHSTLRKAIIYGSVVASYNAEDFSLNRLKTLSNSDIDKRYREFEDMREF